MNPRKQLKETADKTRRMHELYPFTKTVSSAKTAKEVAIKNRVASSNKT